MNQNLKTERECEEFSTCEIDRNLKPKKTAAFEWQAKKAGRCGAHGPGAGRERPDDILRVANSAAKSEVSGGVVVGRHSSRSAVTKKKEPRERPSAGTVKRGPSP
ncbi:hypothetical protein Nepgr_019132 [Nepenthes gracilis]|uniref:Uncharacterized protein n=1 Tax=Nepenthes gracilis TaxID=150966 RepID=A0AAD3SUR2_NEPGR|nr:hypothetical protein Nepgr_019132 [Nepenthes gracilis]